MSDPSAARSIRTLLDDCDSDAVQHRWNTCGMQQLGEICRRATAELRAWALRDPVTVSDHWGQLMRSSVGDRPEWRDWIDCLVMDAKGGRGLQNKYVGQLMLHAVAAQLPVSPDSFWSAPDDDARTKADAAREATRSAPSLAAAVATILSAWQQEISNTLVARGVADVILHRSVLLPEAVANSFDAERLRTTQGALPLHSLFPQAALSAWTTSLEFASEWRPAGGVGAGNRQVVMTALVPRGALWMAPGWGEGELLVSPVSPAGRPVRVLRTQTAD